MSISLAIPDILALTQLIVSLFIAVRALYLYSQSGTIRLFILGLSMSMIALTTAADFVSGYVTTITLTTDWFLFIGQISGFSFILLSLVRGSDDHLRAVMRWQILAFVLILPLLFLAPILPPIPTTVFRAVLSGSRGVIAFTIFFFYVSTFMAKPTRFSLLMSLAFMLMSFGYLLVIEQYAVPNHILLDNAGDIFRMVGLASLLAAVTGK